MTGASDPGHRLARLVFFCDAVFAIAITLLVLEIRLPDLPVAATEVQWQNGLLHVIPHLLAFLLSFFVIGRMWIAHHALFALVGHFHRRLLWPSLLLLLGIVFLPFATTLLSHGEPAATPFMTYCGVLLFTALMKTLLTYRALRPDTLAPHVPAGIVRYERRSAWLMPAASAFALVLCWFFPGWGTAGLFSLAVARRLPWFRTPVNDVP